MMAYIIRRVLYIIPQIIGICVITFLLFEVVYTPVARAKDYAGKGATPKIIADTIYAQKWDKPLFINRTDPYIRAEDVFDWPAFVADLAAAGQAEDAAGSAMAIVWQALPDETRDAVSAAADPQGAVPADVQEKVIDGLNAIVDSEDFYKNAAFVGPLAELQEDYSLAAKPEEEASKKDEERFALDVADPGSRVRRWLNRRMLVGVLENHVAKRYDLPYSGLKMLTETRFVDHMTRLLLFDFGRSEKTGDLIGQRILKGMVPSLTLTVPIFILALVTGLVLSLAVAYFRGTYLDIWATVICVGLMSVSILVYIIAGQYLLATHLRLFPVYGYAGGIGAVQFLLLPIVISVIKGLGGDVRFYRTILLEELGRDYVRTARAKGLSEHIIMLKHVLKNAMIPVLTRTVLAIPYLILGSLLLENFFGIPGLGNMTLEAIQNADFPIVIAMVYLGALLFAVGNLLTDISYTFVDPRVSLR